MKVMLFANDSAPFSQGYAIKGIIGRVGGKLANCGQVVNDQGGQTNLLYLHNKYATGEFKVVQSIWQDTGNTTRCKFRKLDDNHWEELVGEVWQTRPKMDLEFISLDDAQLLQRQDTGK